MNIEGGCPDCGGKLANPVKCRCGWSAVQSGSGPTAARKLACDLTEMCEGEAVISVLVERKRVNCCMPCYHQHHTDQLLKSGSEKSVAEREANRERARKLLGFGARK